MENGALLFLHKILKAYILLQYLQIKYLLQTQNSKQKSFSEPHYDFRASEFRSFALICPDIFFLFSEHVLISSLDILFTIQFAILPACLHLILRLKKKQNSKGIIIAYNSTVLKLIPC